MVFIEKTFTHLKEKVASAGTGLLPEGPKPPKARLFN
jgi:hypothetical protein